MGGAELRALVPTDIVSVWILGAVEFQGWPQIIVPHFPVVVEQASVRQSAEYGRSRWHVMHAEPILAARTACNTIFYTRIRVPAHREAQY